MKQDLDEDHDVDSADVDEGTCPLPILVVITDDGNALEEAGAERDSAWQQRRQSFYRCTTDRKPEEQNKDVGCKL